MVLKLSGHVTNTIFLLYKQNTGWNSDIWNFFSEKIDFFAILVYFHWKSAFWVRPCLKTSLWRHTLTDFHDFGVNGKKWPYPIPRYQTIILCSRQFQVHKGVVTTPLGKPCYKKRLGRTRVIDGMYNVSPLSWIVTPNLSSLGSYNIWLWFPFLNSSILDIMSSGNTRSLLTMLIFLYHFHQ